MSVPKQGWVLAAYGTLPSKVSTPVFPNFKLSLLIPTDIYMSVMIVIPFSCDENFMKISSYQKYHKKHQKCISTMDDYT